MLYAVQYPLVASHFTCQQVCLATGLSPAPGPDTLLLAWARSAPGLEAVSDLEGLLCDGTALCRLALSHGVAPSVLTAALDKPPDRRITTVLQTLQTSRLLPPGMLDQQVPLSLPQFQKTGTWSQLNKKYNRLVTNFTSQLWRADETI